MLERDIIHTVGRYAVARTTKGWELLELRGAAWHPIGHFGRGEEYRERAIRRANDLAQEAKP